jgi:hypothetical protein
MSSFYEILAEQTAPEFADAMQGLCSFAKHQKKKIDALEKELKTVETREDTLTVLSNLGNSKVIELNEKIAVLEKVLLKQSEEAAAGREAMNKVREAIQVAKRYTTEQYGTSGLRIVDIIEKVVPEAPAPEVAVEVVGPATAPPPKRLPRYTMFEDMRVRPCSTTEKALKNVLFCNPGFPFDDEEMFMRTSMMAEKDCMRMVYDPSVEPGCVEANMLQRVRFGLTLDGDETFERCPKPDEITECALRITPMNPPDFVLNDANYWAKILDGTVGYSDRALAISCGKNPSGKECIYKILPSSMKPETCGIFTKNTKITLLSEDSIL